VQGVQAHLQKFWFGENLQQQGKISDDLHKLRESMSKNGTQHLLIWKNWHPIFEELCENSGKNHSHSQKFACSYTYVLTPSVNLAFRPESGFKNKCRSRAGFGLMVSGFGPGSDFKIRPFYNSVWICMQGPTRGDWKGTSSTHQQ